MSNHGGKGFDKSSKLVEWNRGRFLDTKPTPTNKSPTIPWHLTEEEQVRFDDVFADFPLPEKHGSTLKRPFSDPTRLKSNDYAHLVSEIGVYALGNSLAYEQRRVLCRLFRVLRSLTRCTNSIAKLQPLELELIESLAEWELHFPSFVLTINTHLLGHLPIQIVRCGPPPFWWMYGFEREAGRLVDSILSRKNAEESMVRNFLLSEALELRRVSEAKDYDSPVFRRERHVGTADVTMLPAYLRSERICSLHGQKEVHLLTPREQHELLEHWRRLYPEIDAVFRRFEHDVSSGRFQGSIRHWEPCDGGRPLTDRELERCIRFCPLPSGEKYLRGYINGAYFRGISSDRHFVRTNCCFKTSQLYGIADFFFLARAFPHPSAPENVFLRAAAWCEPIAPDPDNFIRRSRQPLDVNAAPLSLSRLFCHLSDILPYPVVLKPFLQTHDSLLSYIFDFSP
jgi:hypothetical protein